MKIIGTLQDLGDGTGTVRVEDVFATGIDDLWDACTRPERLARWIAEVSGELVVGGRFEARFTSGWEGTGRVETCEPPHRLLLATRETGETVDHALEVTLTAERDQTKLIIEERGLPGDQLAAYGAGWQVHVEDLAAHLAGRDRCDLPTRWAELLPSYQQLTVP